MNTVFQFVAWTSIALVTGGPLSAQVVKYGACTIDFEDLPLPHCALEIRGGQLYVLRKFADDVFSRRNSGIIAHPVSVEGHRLAWTYLPDEGWAYFDPSGLVVVRNVATYDNGASEFHHRLVLVTKGEKWGLSNARGKLVVPMQYDGMLDDWKGPGWLACSGCQKVHQGEHWWFSGGTWVRLDERGRLVGEADDPPRPPTLHDQASH